MKRAQIVIAGTIVGLAGLLSFNSTAVNLSLGSLSAATSPPRSTTTTPSTTTTTAPHSSGSTPPPTTTRVVPTTTTTAPPAAARSATGTSSNYSYGILSVKVSVSGTTITNISIASINDGGNPRSQYIDQQSIPLLEQQALSAQSANIQGVSGASYTSAGFEQSLQSALSKLGL
ncbi:MAG: FMN-binding protein [Acidimicrobiales bacterium]|jgi:uncharacterized protein with FMN-binding domain